jgi:5-methyltetrahydropteroyltriglutamate--homocysteine methyltransferase
VLAAKASPEGELKYAVDLINRVADGFNDLHIGVHVCRGNWSTKEGVLLEGGYEPLIPWLAKMKVNQFALEYATPRAGRLEAIAGLSPGACLGLGTVNPRTIEVEHPRWIADRAMQAANLLDTHTASDPAIPPGRKRVFLNPDCGFGTFADRPISTHELAKAKLEALVAAAKSLR